MRAAYSEIFELYEDDEGEYLEVEWTGPQSTFLQSTCTYPLFVGGFGSGKSTTMIGAMIQDLVRYPGANVAGYAPTYDLLTLITVPKTIEFLEAMELDYEHNKSRFFFEVEDYGTIILRSLDNPGKIIGYETFRAHVDEIDTLPKKKAEDAWNKIIARNRQNVYVRDVEGKKIPRMTVKNKPILRKGRPTYYTEKNRVSAYTTPEGYAFCYNRWVKNPSPQYQMFKAPTRSNPYLPEDYIQNLIDTYPPHLVDAYLNGDFVNMTSGQVYSSFDRVLNHSDETVQGREPLYVGMDFNVMFGSAVIHVLRDKNPVAVDEIVNAYDTQDQIRILLERYPNNPIIVYADASGTNRTSANTTSSDIKQLKDAGFKVKTKASNPPIKNRVASMNGMLCSSTGKRRYKVNTTKCPEYVASLEQQIYGANGLPDKSENLDHIVDAPGYYIEYEFGLTKPKTEVTVIHGAY